MDILDAVRTTHENYIAARKQAAELHPLKISIPSLEFGEPWRLSGDWLIVGDVHVPSTDWEFSALVSHIATRTLEPPRRLLIAGDLFNMDRFSFYPNITIPPTWGEERSAAEQLLSMWMKTFDEVWWMVGNHDRRLQKIMVEVLETTDLLSVIISNPDRTHFSNFSYCNVNSAGEEYLVVHPKNYSRNPLTVARVLSEKNKKHVISFHEHHAGITWDHSGEHVIVNGGTLADPDKIAYQRLDMSTVPVTKRGFVLLQNGVPYLFGPPPLTDWSLWL